MNNYYENSGTFDNKWPFLFILLQGPEVGVVNPLLIQPASQTLAGKYNSFLSPILPCSPLL